MRPDLRVLLEVEGVTTLESYLLQQTEEELRSICSTHYDLRVLHEAEGVTTMEPDGVYEGI
jgi:hypothetical protein